MTNLLNMKEEKAVMALDKFLRDNPEMMDHQVDLMDKMKNITDPTKRFEFLTNELSKASDRLKSILTK